MTWKHYSLWLLGFAGTFTLFYGASRAGDEQRASYERQRVACTAAGFDWIQGDCIRRAVCVEKGDWRGR